MAMMVMVVGMVMVVVMAVMVMMVARTINPFNLLNPFNLFNFFNPFDVTVHGHVEERARKAAAGRAGRAQLHAGRQERGEAGDGGGRIGDELQQRGGEHVAGGAGFKLQVERLHGAQ